MKEIVIFAGTTEGRELSEYLAEAEIRHTVCVATEYGEVVLKEHPQTVIHKGRMNREEIREFLKKGEFAAVVDATHPYAETVTENIRQAVNGLDIPYLRLQRETAAGGVYGKTVFFESNEACAKALEKTEGNILLTTGSKELAVYCAEEKVRDRLYVRVLPGIESLQLCMAQGIVGKQILAMQGPFSVEMNEAILHQYNIACMVTKESGKAGGYQEKIQAAQKAGIPVYVIGRPEEKDGLSFAQVCSRLEKLCGSRAQIPQKSEIILAGAGMGQTDSLTCEVMHAIGEADILLGARRMIEKYHPKLEKMPYYSPTQIIPYLQNLQKQGVTGKKVVILFSGDSGFYSGCQSLYQALCKETDQGNLYADITVLPGISSVSYLASCIGESYQDAAIYSMHGKTLSNPAAKIRQNSKCFLLMSGAKDMRRLGEILAENDLTHCQVIAGYQLSYEEQQISCLTAKECRETEKEGLYVCCIKNPMPQKPMLTHGKNDACFIRDKVPMTKEEVREISICKLKLHKGAVLYDIGSGTGSMAIETAGLSDDITVYAIEKKEEALVLIEKNKEKFALDNIHIVAQDAPNGLETLPVPTHAFIGGSGGKMKEILQNLYQKNPAMRIVINAVSMETIAEMVEILQCFPMKEKEMVQIQVSRTRQAGAYHLMQAENPVWVCAFTFGG